MASDGHASPSGAIIRRLVINRFRGIKQLVWLPKPGLNVILGAGDSGKTTILEAIALLLSPTNATVLSDSDYWERDRAKEFFIGAVLSLPPSTEVHNQRSPLWPWEWDGEDAKAPQISEDGGSPAHCGPPVYKLCVTGNLDLDLSYELREPSGNVNSLSPNLRRQIGLVRLSGDDRNDRDLRLVQGSALDRLISDQSLRSRLGDHFSDSDVRDILQEEGKEALAALDGQFIERALPNDLGLGLSAIPSQSISALDNLPEIKSHSMYSSLSNSIFY